MKSFICAFVVFLFLSGLTELKAENEILTLVKEIFPNDVNYAYPNGITALGNKVVFIGDDGINEREPWISDGTEVGTAGLYMQSQVPDSENLFVVAKFNDFTGYELYILSQPKGISDSESRFNLYPNPTTDLIYLDHIYGSENNSHLIITDISGRIIFSKPLEKGRTDASVDLNFLESGAYIIKAGNSIRKFKKN